MHTAVQLTLTLEIASIQLTPTSIGSMRLTPSPAQKPVAITSPSFEITGCNLSRILPPLPWQLTLSYQAQASVLVTASFRIATVEFSPLFEIASIMLNSTSKNVAVQLPGAGPSSIEGAPVLRDRKRLVNR
jgi:hypothetical protein